MAMKTRIGKMRVSALALAVEAVLVAMYALPAHADDEQSAALKIPTNWVELGAIGVSSDSAKFGEYTGLNKSGGYFIGDFSLRGGDAYGDGNGIRRWAITGSDLGLTSRAIGATISDQGRWNFGISFDELRHYTSDSYQTPYQGSMGGNSFTLPAGFAPVTDTRALTAAQLAAFQNMDINNTRENTSLTAGFNANRQWDFKVDYNHLDQSGAKLMGFGSAQWPATGTSAITGQRISILPMPTNYTTDTVNVALNWLGEKGHATGSYSGSFFRDNNNGVTFQTFAGAGAPSTQTMGTPPGNDFHQFNLTGGYAFSGRTKLAGGLSYSRNTQNTAYGYDSGVGAQLGPMVTASPTDSLNGYVANTHADLKLTDQTTKDLVLSALVKYDNRDNRTVSNIYNARSIDGGNIYNYPNTPLSIMRTQVELAGDYRLDPKQKIRLALSHDEIDRQCNQYAEGGGTPAYAAGTNCVTATKTKEDKLSATYRLKASNDVNLNAGYGYSDRRTTFDENARAAMIGTDGNVVVPGLGITGLNAADFRGFHPFFEASRKQNMLNAGANWQASDKLSVGASGRYTYDDYDSDYGVQKGSAWSLNLDTTYSYSKNGVLTVYLTQQERMRDMTNLQRSPTTAASATVPPGGSWNNSMKDTDTTVGLNLKQGGLMGGKLVLAGDVTYSLAKTAYNTTLNYDLLGPTPCTDPTIYTCVALPDIKSEMIQFKLTGIYQLDKSGKIAVGYLYRNLNSEDYYYNGLQYGSTPSSVMPTNQTEPSYHVNMVWASYIYTF
jgi:MtrB/PioB family decaheme-associated outer membrane protein